MRRKQLPMHDYYVRLKLNKNVRDIYLDGEIFVKGFTLSKHRLKKRRSKILNRSYHFNDINTKI